MSTGKLHIVENVHSLPIGHVRDVAAAVRAFADCIEDGSLTARKALIVTVDDDGMLDFTAFGEPVTSAEALGLLDLAKAKIIAGTWR